MAEHMAQPSAVNAIGLGSLSTVSRSISLHIEMCAAAALRTVACGLCSIRSTIELGTPAFCKIESWVIVSSKRDAYGDG